MPASIVIGGIYEHYTKKSYRVIALAKHSETLEDMVVYEALYENEISKIWVRPRNMFLETVLLGGNQVSRFRLLD